MIEEKEKKARKKLIQLMNEHKKTTLFSLSVSHYFEKNNYFSTLEKILASKKVINDTC